MVIKCYNTLRPHIHASIYFWETYKSLLIKKMELEQLNSFFTSVILNGEQWFYDYLYDMIKILYMWVYLIIYRGKMIAYVNPLPYTWTNCWQVGWLLVLGSYTYTYTCTIQNRNSFHSFIKCFLNKLCVPFWGKQNFRD